MANEPKVNFIQPSKDEELSFWQDIKDVCEKYSMVLSTGFHVQKAIKLNTINEKDLA